MSTLYGGTPFEARFATASADGFECVEFWVADDVLRVAETVRGLALSVSQINVDPGPGANDAGRLSDPDATAWWRSKFDEALTLAAALDCPVINVLAGGSAAGDRHRERQTMLENLEWALARLGGSPVTLVLEPLNHHERPHYLLHTIDDVVDARASLGDPANVKLLFDAYHVYQEHDDLVAAFVQHESIVGHVQLADFPGRCEPGAGEIDVAAFIEAVARSGYDGWIGLEFVSQGPASALAWTHAIPVPPFRHGVPTEIGTPTGP